MSEIANARIKTFGPSPEADEPVFEVPLSELEGLLEALVETHNQIAAVVQEAGILRGRELARVTANHTQALRAEKSPIMKIHLINIYIRRHVIRIREALKARPTVGGGKVVQVVSKPRKNPILWS